MKHSMYYSILRVISNFAIVVAILGCAGQSQNIQGSKPDVGHGGPSIHFPPEYQQGDMRIRVVYGNKNGLGRGNTIYPQFMRVSVSSGGKVVYQFEFFKTTTLQARLDEFPLQNRTAITIDDLSLWKGVVLSGSEEETHRSILRGLVEVNDKFQAHFSGTIIYADQKEITDFSKWGWSIDNVFKTSQRDVILKQGVAVRIENNLLR